MARRRQSRRKRRTKRRTTRKLVKRQLGMLPSVSSDDIFGDMHRIVKKLKTSHGSGSKTMTGSKTDEWTESQEDGIKFKNVTIAYKPTSIGKLTQKLTSPGTVYDFNSSGIASVEGRQEAEIVSAFSGGDYINLNVTLNNNTVVNALRESQKQYISTIKHEIEFNNCGPTTCEFDIYMLIDKNTTKTATLPLALWDAAIVSESNVALAPLGARQKLWSKPTDLKGFRINYWTKKTTCTLTPGESCKLTYQFKQNRLLDAQYFNDWLSIRGLTHQIMVVVRGTLCDGTKSNTVTAGQQSIAPAKLIWIAKRTYTGYICNTLPRIVRQIGTELPTGIATMWHQDEDGGAVEDAALPGNFA